MNSGLKDSGKRYQYATGARREPLKDEKGRYDLIPPGPLHRLAVHYARGAKKYADRNWEKGLPLGRYVDSAKRHFDQFLSGDRSEDHLAAVLWNVCGLMWTEARIQAEVLPAELNDLPDVVIPSRSRAEASILQARTAESAAEQIGASGVRDAVLGDPHAAADGGVTTARVDARALELVERAFPRLPPDHQRSLAADVAVALANDVPEMDIVLDWFSVVQAPPGAVGG